MVEGLRFVGETPSEYFPGLVIPWSRERLARVFEIEADSMRTTRTAEPYVEPRLAKPKSVWFPSSACRVSVFATD